uniref:Uncharacterized protein n=1 Tax=Anguilla anguilla TaxID=7936 RepID=A0A0E9V9A6_ANGAN
MLTQCKALMFHKVNYAVMIQKIKHGESIVSIPFATQ